MGNFDCWGGGDDDGGEGGVGCSVVFIRSILPIHVKLISHNTPEYSQKI